MSKKDTKDPHAVIVLGKLLQIIDLGMIEELQQAEYSYHVAKNLELAETFDAKKGKSFFSRSTDKINKILHKTGVPPIFNHQLTEGSLDRILVLIDYLKKYIDVEGIFRIPGNKKRQEELKHLLDKDMEINFQQDHFTEHDVASVLKQFFAELPEPIIPAGHINIHMQIIVDISNKEKHIKALQLLFLLIPPLNRHLLQLLLELLHEISNKKEINKMKASNLAVVFAPSIILYKHRSSSCLSAVPEDIATFIAALAFMIDHEKEIFTIPDDLLAEIKKHNSSRNAQNDDDDDDMLVVSKPFCAQVDGGGYHTADALVDLYAHVSKMEDTPMKRQFLKRFAENCPGTPPFKPKTRKNEEEPFKPNTQKTTEEEQKATFTAPRILSPSLFRRSSRSWTRLPLKDTNTTRSQTDSLCSSPTGRFRLFRTPAGECTTQSKTEDSHENIPQVPATPSGHFNLKLSTPSSIRNPFKRKRRTKSIGSSNAESSSLTRLFFSPKPARRSSSSSQLEKNSPCVHSSTSDNRTPAPLTATSKKPKNLQSTITAPVIKKSLIGRDIRNLYTTPMNSKKRNNVFPSGK